ncbi:hypothetical protein Slin14017_G100130 [Septoria linicola]|nr:hypothetical protein Slin14017_G100130 [Septoria linicola]
MSSTDFFQNFWSGNWLQIVPSAWRFGAQKNVVRTPFPIASTSLDANSIDNNTSMSGPIAGPRSSRSGARPSQLSIRTPRPSSRPSRSSGRKRSPSPGLERPQKKLKLSKTPEDKTSKQLLKLDGVNTATGQIVNPEGVIAGRFPSYFPTTQSDESKGFRNVSGSQCYRSSLLQALLHAPAYIAAVRARNGYDFETINDNSIEFDSNVSGLEFPSSFESYFDSYVLVYSLSSPPEL